MDVFRSGWGECVSGVGMCMCSLVWGGGGGCTNEFLRMEGFNDVLYFISCLCLNAFLYIPHCCIHQCMC